MTSTHGNRRTAASENVTAGLMCAPEVVAEHVHRDGDHQREGDRDDPEPRVVELALSHLERRHERSSAEEHEQRRADELGEQATAKVGVHDRSDGRL